MKHLIQFSQKLTDKEHQIRQKVLLFLNNNVTTSRRFTPQLCHAHPVVQFISWFLVLIPQSKLRQRELPLSTSIVGGQRIVQGSQRNPHRWVFVLGHIHNQHCVAV